MNVSVVFLRLRNNLHFDIFKGKHADNLPPSRDTTTEQIFCNLLGACHNIMLMANRGLNLLLYDSKSRAAKIKSAHSQKIHWAVIRLPLV